jgi:hypothetical protein
MDRKQVEQPFSCAQIYPPIFGWITEKLRGLDNQDSSIVVFGSLARDEATPGSDLDWTLLVDGKADPEHVRLSQEIRRKIPGDKNPGPEGIFGSLAFSHQIIHCIGGEDDSNANTTLRLLLLLESIPIGNKQAWESVQNNILRRYIDEDLGLQSKTNTRGVLLFLLNDIARYWRIMVVDFAYKQRERENEGYALRNIKLGLSRKLIYASGLLACFSCESDFPRKQLFVSGNAQRAVEHLRGSFRKTPLEIVASTLIQYEELREPSKRLFDNYDRFVGLLASEDPIAEGKSPREYLKALSPGDLAQDPVFTEAQAVRREFGNAMTDIFLRVESPIQKLMIERGVF